MSTTVEAFDPTGSKTYLIPVTTASVPFNVPGLADATQVRLVGGAGDVRVEFGKTVSVAAAIPTGAAAPSPGTPGSMLIKAGSVEIVSVDIGLGFLAVIGAAASTLEITLGRGL